MHPIDPESSGVLIRLAAVGRLVPPVSHDINNPLAALLGRIQIHLTRGTAGMPRGPAGLDDMYEQALVISDKVQTLGTLARQVLQDAPPTPSVLPDHVAEITQLLGRHLARRCAELRMEIPSTVPPVLIRPVDLKLCLAEIILGLCGALRDPTELTILAEERGEEVLLILRVAGFTPSAALLPKDAILLSEVAAVDGLRLTVDDAFTLSMPKAPLTRPGAP